MNTINKIHNTILKKIESGAIRQKPKWHFVLVTLSFVFALVTLSLIFLYLVSFVGLVLREHLIFDALSFGPRTVFTIMHTLPFLLIVLVATVFLLLHVLVRHFAFAYMKPVMVTLLLGLLLTLVLFASVLLGDKNSRIAKIGEGRHVPGIEALHVRFRDQIPPLVLHGSIVNKQDGVYVIRDVHDKELQVMLTENTRTDKEMYEVGDRVMLIAERTPEILRAVAIRIYDETKRSFSRPPKELERP